MPSKFLQVDKSSPTVHYERTIKTTTTATPTANTAPLPQFLTAMECAAILRYEKPDKIYLLVRSGILKGFKRGKRWLIDKEYFDRWCKCQCGLLPTHNYSR